MPNPKDRPNASQPPQWAVDQASEEVGAGPEASATIERASQIVREADALQAERHDEYDDPDEGGEG
jgi:hypothetical protein